MDEVGWFLLFKNKNKMKQEKYPQNRGRKRKAANDPIMLKA